MDDNHTTLLRNLAKQSLELHKSTPYGAGIQDMDTLLKDIMDTHVMPEENGIGPELIRIWMESQDQASVENVFHLLSGVTLQEYLETCIRETTRA